MAPIGWKWAFMVWGYALAWFLINDRVKLGAYKIFDRQDGGLMAYFLQRREQHATAK